MTTDNPQYTISPDEALAKFNLYGFGNPIGREFDYAKDGVPKPAIDYWNTELVYDDRIEYLFGPRGGKFVSDGLKHEFDLSTRIDGVCEFADLWETEPPREARIYARYFYAIRKAWLDYLEEAVGAAKTEQEAA